MGKALLINPSYFRTYSSNEGGIAFPVYPVLGLASLSAAARDRGHDVTILDLSYRPYDPAEVRALIGAERPDLIGITATTPLMNQARDISFIAKDVAPDAITIAGGAHPSALPGESLRESAFDLVAAGEADFVVADLLDGKRPESLGGLWHRDGASVIAPTRPAGLVERLDDLPLPRWEEFPMEGNKRITRLVSRYLPVTVMEFSRGCIYSCDFCASKNTMGRGYRKKSPERCVEELERAARCGFREVVLVDDIFTTDNNWAAEVCEAIIRSGVKMAWTCTNGIRVDSANTELFALMRRAGCYKVGFGFESGSDEVLKAFGKGGRASLQQGIEAVDMARAAGVEPHGYFMVGLTGDTEATMQDTIDFARDVRLDTMKCGICVPYPGTPMFQQLYRLGRIKSLDWDDYTVYNNASEIFDHPTLSWDTITRQFRRFYVESLLKNPRYIWRRLRYAVRRNELFWNMYYAVRFLGLVLRRRKDPGAENYEFSDQWRPLDLQPETPLPDVVVPIVRRRGTVVLTARDG